ncbi:hypothetical protein BUPH_08561 [Paraburkholderia phenoliruptrix BR3459a]|uniref:Uncharacterized protein n=1 Tax=Paraburkholderia phenoliruptrix BR3459a TaxID=1229205 RepID=K0DLI1_9BURK|nr:hypothetical protein BUPH_08561 [Paraburkholderia phenoliruptrix BR3459a]
MYPHSIAAAACRERRFSASAALSRSAAPEAARRALQGFSSRAQGLACGAQTMAARFTVLARPYLSAARASRPHGAIDTSCYTRTQR